MEDNQQIPGHPDELNEMLLVLDKKQNKMQAVKQLTKNGEVKAADINDKNQPDFLRIERHGDFFSNFFGNFTRQLKEPTRFDFFRVPFSLGLEIACELQGYLNDLGEDAQQLLSKYAINSEYQHKNHTTMETTEEYKFKPEQVNWESLNNLGLSRERLEKMNLIEPLLKGFKTNDLVPLTLTMGDAVAKLDARLSLQTNDAGQVVVAMHGIRKEPNLNYPFFGHEFSKEDKENLLKTGNMGRVVDLYNQKTSEFVPSLISVDRKTNELVAYKAEWVQIPDEIKGIKLDEQQKQALQEGKSLYLEGMTSKNGDPFDATVQFNADKRYVEFIFDRNQGQNQSQGKTYDEAPTEFRGKELTEEQYSKFKEGMTVYITGLIDKNDKEYQGYITYNSESGKVGFSFNNPSKSKEEALPETSPQTSQATAESKMSQDRNPTKKDDKKQQKENIADKQQDQEDAPAKKRGRKI
ncbi:DUF3945 domain-containing protein [Flavobacterium coralii]|uniref:DUF3945 domain-containing protein n=1 Tax=Flavobacterium coralii TaxID=2838017 RepID=UPI000C35E9E8|nr:hypothetical protein [Flavobacterium sp.]|tara:strand:- start:11943 stop:13340 length:1398 start_codon:yes stop_codon:yes gene_type:complete